MLVMHIATEGNAVCFMDTIALKKSPHLTIGEKKLKSQHWLCKGVVC